MCPALWAQRMRQDYHHKAGERTDPSILPGRTSGPCAGRRAGDQQPPHVPDRRQGGVSVPESQNAVFNVDTDSEIAFGIENEARPPRELAERVEQTTEDLRIQSLRGRNIFELSGGEKQKIAFASVYAMNPEIYLLDEPSSNLDMTSIQELREHLRLVRARARLS